MNALFRSSAWLAALIMAVAALLYFRHLETVKAPIWDETYYLTSTARYHEGRTQFASHPPLGMMLIAAGDMASGRNSRADWKRIGAEVTIATEAMPAGFDYAGPRLAPALFGAIAAGLFALIMLELTASTWAAALLSLLFLADTAVLVQVRAAQLDAFQLAFVLGAILAALLAVRRRGWLAPFAFGACLVAAVLVRANAAMLGIMAPFLLWPAAKAQDLPELGKRIAAGAIGGLAAALLTLAAYIAMTPLAPDPATPAGKGDLALIAPAHARALETGKWGPAAAIGVAQGIQARMRDDLAATTQTDARGSHPGDWLVGSGMILFRSDRSSGTMHAIGLAPNLVVWLVSLFGVITSLLPSRLAGNRTRTMLLLAWGANMAALQYLDGLRVLYLYHYFIPLMLGHAMAAMEWKRMGLPRRGALVVAAAVLAFAAALWPFALGEVTPGWLCGTAIPGCTG